MTKLSIINKTKTLKTKNAQNIALSLSRLSSIESFNISNAKNIMDSLKPIKKIDKVIMKRKDNSNYSVSDILKNNTSRLLKPNSQI